MGSYTIREMARKFDMQPSTLRYYEDQGLLTDVGRDDAGVVSMTTSISGDWRRLPASSMRV